MSRDKLHLTVAAVVHYQQRFLLVEEREKVTAKRVLNQPAGHVEQDEDLISAIKRELLEETGLSLSPCSWLGISQLTAANGHRYVRVNFVFEPLVLPKSYQPQDADIIALHWLSPAELAEHALPVRSQLVIDAIDNYLAGVRLPLNLIQGPA
ncbi:NUDIX domain-containing protein [Arsukibacterium sp.]|uniref:NUDIX domain-containing protein n=1 Tax=Arsukibacterium sp. TaxID=1977258 RepID=UPI002FD9D63E